MEPLAIVLVLFSAACHAGWNYLVQVFKRPLVGMWLMTATGIILYLPVFVFTSRSLVITMSLGYPRLDQQVTLTHLARQEATDNAESLCR